MKKRFIPRVNINTIPVLTSTEIPPIFFYPLVQGTAKEPELQVKIKQRVSAGELLAASSNDTSSSKKGSQNIHSAIGGTVKGIRSFRYSGNYNSAKAVEIEFGGKFNTFSKAEEIDFASLQAQKVFADLSKAGIFDLDIGPLEVKIENILKQRTDKIILNALEISPFMVLEEKILDLHHREIASALALLQQSIKTIRNDDGPDILVVSNYAKNRKNVIRGVQGMLGKTKKVQGRSLSMSVGLDAIPNSNYTWLLQALFDDKQSDGIEIEQSIDQSLILRPSTLLAIYEAVFCGKPYIEKYVQIVVSDKKTFILKTFLGIPLFYLLTQTGEIEEGTNHFFIDDFMKRSVVFDFTTPVSKHFSHIFTLTDENFSIMYTRLKPWHQSASNVS